MEHLMAWVGVELYAAWAAVTYWRLRTWQMPAEMAETRWWICDTPVLRPFTAVLLAALPAIAELTCVINGLLWPAEVITRPWRT